jgi:hypothetical protein
MAIAASEHAGILRALQALVDVIQRTSLRRIFGCTFHIAPL